jgi:Ca-activated chloride channel homolog
MTFEWPLMLVSLALVPLLIGLYYQAQRRRRAYTLRFTNLALLEQVVGKRPGLRRHLPPLLFLFGIAALLFSLARPNAVFATPREEATVMLVMDVSHSMAADDLTPNRMAAAQAAAHAFVEALPPNLRVGLISFSSAAAVQLPPTDDRAALGQAVDRLWVGGGTAIGDGLNLALDQIAAETTRADEPLPALVVLLSDGQSSLGAPPAEAAERAQAMGVPVYTVGVGQRDAQVFVNGQPVQLDEETLRAVAAATGGDYFYAAESNQLAQVYADLGAQLRWVAEPTEITAPVAALGTLLLLAGGLLSLRWFHQVV